MMQQQLWQQQAYQQWLMQQAALQNAAGRNGQAEEGADEEEAAPPARDDSIFMRPAGEDVYKRQALVWGCGWT